MKLAIALIIIGGILLIDGGARIMLGLIGAGIIPIVAGLLTGVLLGGYLMYRGIKRYIRIKGTSQAGEE